jgi:hypothetical protein
MNHADQATRGTSDRVLAGRQPILSQTEADRRMLLLADLQSSLTGLGIRCVLARNHRIVMRNSKGPSEPSGLTDPQLHIFTPDGTCIATTDRAFYRLTSGHECPASDPTAAAAMIHSRRPGSRA